MTREEELLHWAWDIYWGGEPPPLEKAKYCDLPSPSWNDRAALARLKDWLNAPPQGGVLEELRAGLGQLGWDTPSAAGRRLISELVWSTVLARFGVIPVLRRPRRPDHNVEFPRPLFSVYVLDAPHGSERWERSGWHVMVEPTALGDEEPALRQALEWVLNALLHYDVELGLTDQPLYLRRHRRDDDWRPAGVVQPDEQAAFEQPPSCPRCGLPMMPRQNVRSGNMFWGCLNYPECRGSLNWKTNRR